MCAPKSTLCDAVEECTTRLARLDQSIRVAGERRPHHAHDLAFDLVICHAVLAVRAARFCTTDRPGRRRATCCSRRLFLLNILGYSLRFRPIESFVVVSACQLRVAGVMASEVAAVDGGRGESGTLADLLTCTHHCVSVDYILTSRAVSVYSLSMPQHLSSLIIYV